MREKWGCLEINWNNWNTGTTGILEQLERSSFVRGFSSAVMPLFSKALPQDVLLSEALPVMALPSLAPAICSKLRQKGISVSLRLLPPSSPVISPNRTQSHRIARLGWQKDLTLQHEHDSWVGPPPDWPRQTSASPAESKSPRSLTY